MKNKAETVILSTFDKMVASLLPRLKKFLSCKINEPKKKFAFLFPAAVKVT